MTAWAAAIAAALALGTWARGGPHDEQLPTFSQKELNALVGAAHDMGRFVAAHA